MESQSPEKLWRELESAIGAFPDRYDRELISRAFLRAKECHAGQKRIAGGAYICHPLRVARHVAEFQIDTPTVQAALLHDVAEDTPRTIEEIQKEFGEEVAFLVNGVTKLGHIKYRGVEEEVENLRKMMLAMSEDIRVILIKLADRFDNMRTIEALPPEKRRRIALETLDLYAPIAHRLGIGELAGDLEDLAFPIVYPKEYQWLMEHVRERYEARRRYLESLVPLLQRELEQNRIMPVSVHARAKHYYSLYRKLLRKDMNLEIVYDLVALRVIVRTVEECYGALGVVHALWKPLPGRIKDYIALPKPNGYRSIHTTVFGPEGKIIEAQIRTADMHEESERGIAAHWHYADTKSAGRRVHAIPKEFAWVGQLQNWQREHKIADDFIESLKIDFFKDRIFVITPKGEVIDLPDGATPVDFAYHIHSEVGNTCSGARVNGRIVPLDYRLASGEVVEILTQRNKMPSAEWLEFVRTSFAKGKIRDALRRKQSTGSLAKRPAGKTREAKFSLTVKDRVGLIQDISRVFAAAKINIHEFTTKGEASSYPIITVTCTLPEQANARLLTLALRKIKNVEEVSFKIK